MKILGSAIIGGAVLASGFKTIEKVPYTKEDLNNTKAYVTTIRETKRAKEVDFVNENFLSSLTSSIGHTPCIEEIRALEELTIECQNCPYDLSDLKYFTNLRELTILNAQVDLQDLTYNKSLEYLTIKNCTITNTNHLPNTITDIELINTTIEDNLLYTPYNLISLYIANSSFTNIKPKCPKNLQSLKIVSKTCMVDLSFLEECNNLNSICLYYCPNITHPEALSKLPSTCKILLDDYAPIWLTKENYNKISVSNPSDTLVNEIDELDDLANTLVPDKSVDDFIKIRSIINYIIKELEYSPEVRDLVDQYTDISGKLNETPIKYALYQDEKLKSVCINYACMFQALANRVGIESIQLFGNRHTWNIASNQLIDVTALDDLLFQINDEIYLLQDILNFNENLPEEFYYSIDSNDPIYQGIYNYQPVDDIDNNIGYVPLSKKDTTKLIVYSYKSFVCIEIYLLIFTLINAVIEKTKNHKKEKTTNKENEQRMKI